MGINEPKRDMLYYDSVVHRQRELTAGTCWIENDWRRIVGETFDISGKLPSHQHQRLL